MILATDTQTLGNVIKYELEPRLAYCRTVGIYNGTAGDLLVGTVLGKVTATGKFKIAVQSAVDGSQNPAAIVVAKVTGAALNTDTNVLVMFRGPASVSASALVFDATFDQPAELTAAYASLEALGIQVLTTA